MNVVWGELTYPAIDSARKINTTALKRFSEALAGPGT